MERAGKVLVIIVCALLVSVGAAAVVSAEEVPRISKEVLKALLGNPEVAVVDVRLGTDWNASEFKIKGAVRESKEDISWVDKYGKDKVLVLYCA